MKDDQPLLGSWFLRIDRFTDVHAVAAQNKDQSCGLASVKMVVFKINKLKPGKAAFKTERTIENKYRELAGEPAHDFENTGATLDNIVKVLNALDIGTWEVTKPAVDKVGTKIAEYLGTDQFGLGLTGINALTRGAPVIIGCRWKKGGHLVVVDTVTHVPALGTYATICDPWDGNVHFARIEAGKPFTYQPGKAAGINFWGHTKNDKSPYSGSSIGSVVAILHQV